MEKLFQYSKKLISEVNTDFSRYLYYEINWNNRLIGIIGARGVGKTTLVLQHIKNNQYKNEALYVTAEDFYFAKNKILDLADEFVKSGGKYLYIDEIHKYPDWSKELKLIYDYYKELKIVFTGSSILDIKKGSSDLSRRTIIYSLYGLSFREYLNFHHKKNIKTYSLKDLLTQKIDNELISHPLMFFKEYLKKGYYPFFTEDDFFIRLQQLVNQSLEIDIPTYANMNVSTGRKLKQMLAIIAASVPFKPNMSKIADLLNVSRNNISDYLQYIEDAGLINQLKSSTNGIRSLGKVEKIYLENTNLNFLLAKDNQNMGNLRETFFLNQLKVKYKVQSSNVVDFQIDDVHFEIGGKQKKQNQIKNIPNSFIVKDDIEISYLNVIPLWYFGLLY